MYGQNISWQKKNEFGRKKTKNGSQITRNKTKRGRQKTKICMKVRRIFEIDFQA